MYALTMRAVVSLLALVGCYGVPPPPAEKPPPPPAPGWIQGVVKDGNLGPEQDVLVEARRSEHHVLASSTRTDAHGWYKLSFAPGDYVVEFTFPSNLQLTEAAHVTSDRTKALFERDPTPGHIPNCSDPEGAFSVRFCLL